MPQLIRTPEQIFREEGKDIYFIRFREEEDNNDFPRSHQENSPASNEIRQWLKTNLPNARMENLAPSEESGWISGYFGDIRVDFSEADLAKFGEQWEDADGGSKDPRFQCFLIPYKTWFEKHGYFVPTLDRPVGLGPTVWWDTPIGFVYHQIAADELTESTHPGHAEDIWMHAVRLWPELASLEADNLTHGSIFKDSDGNWVAMFSDRPWAGSEFSRQGELRQWFHLPEDAKIFRDEW